MCVWNIFLFPFTTINSTQKRLGESVLQSLMSADSFSFPGGWMECEMEYSKMFMELEELTN